MRLILLAACALSLTACATAAPAPGTQAGLRGDRQEKGDPYGLFLAGRAALNSGQAQKAQTLFGRARLSEPDNPTLRAQAFAAALAAGDVAKAVTLAPGPEATPQAQSLGRLTRATHALAIGRHKEAYTLLSGEPLAAPHTLAAALLRPWAAAGAGQPVQATVMEGENALAEAVADVGGIELLERAGRIAEADAQVAALDLTRASTDAVLTHGAYLERRRRAGEATRLYERALAARPDSSPLQAALSRVKSGRKPPPAPTLREGAAEGLLVPAVILAGAQQTETALAYLRLALHLDPKRDEAWVTLGELLVNEGDLDGARRAFLMPERGSEQFPISRARLSLALEEAGRKEEALETARAAAEAAPSVFPLQEAYASLLVERGRHDDVVALFDRILATSEGAANWRAWYLRGAAHERAGRWAPAEADLQKALSMAPQEPEVLNYLGYGWVDRGQRLKEAMGMIERASELRPRSGAIVDSLGWAHYRLGDFPAAVGQLERAAELEPADPVINDHLGDAYWRTGRRIEAAFQWQRVLTLEPDAALRRAVEAKLASPLGPDASGRAVASGQ
jgi:tetratricopeptide (TPR) repeat protein